MAAPSSFSLSTLRTITNPKIQPHRKEYIYQVFSSAPPSLNDLVEKLNVLAQPVLPLG